MPLPSHPFAFSRSERKRLCVASLLLLAVPVGALAEIRHVIHISVDGLRGDFLRNLVQQPASPYVTFARFEAEGAVTYNARCDFSHSVTTPNHTSMITGRPVLAEPPLPVEIQHGYRTNYTIETDLLQDQGFPPGYKASTFDRVHDRGLRTALLVGKSKMGIFVRSFGPDHGALDPEGEDHGRNKIDLAQVQDGQSPLLVQTLLAQMDLTFPAYTFMHLAEPDFQGHGFGWTSEAWRQAVKDMDGQLGLIMAALDARPALKAATAIIITSDHGGGVPDNHHADPAYLENCTIPVIIWGGGIPGGMDAHELFTNRRDPGASLIGNTYLHQPLRNGDTGNIAMALLGLPPVEGSFHRPVLLPRLDIHRELPGKPQHTVTLRWPFYLGGLQLQQSAALEEDSWSAVDGPPSEEGVEFTHTVTTPPGTRLFFRLKPLP